MTPDDRLREHRRDQERGIIFVLVLVALCVVVPFVVAVAMLPR
jgi:hypothetical protein